MAYSEIVSQDLEPLRGLAEEHGFDVLLAVFPDLDRQSEGVYPLAERHNSVVQVAKSKGFDTLDLLPGFLSAGDGDLHQLLGRCGGMHLDEFGHRVAAQLIHDRITRYAARDEGSVSQ